MYPKLRKTIHTLMDPIQNLDEERKLLVKPLIDFVQQKFEKKEPIQINFICTHNSRRSLLAQIWAHVASQYYGISPVFVYSGGTEQTAMYPKIVETLTNQGFEIVKLVEHSNSVYVIQYDEVQPPILGFSKLYNHPIHPDQGFAAVMTCHQADGDCPFIPGAEKRISIPYEDPKISDYSLGMDAVYEERSRQIASEMFYVFSNIKSKSLV